MKHLLILALMVLLTYSLAAQDGWQYQQSNTTRNLHGVHTSNGVLAWAVGDSATVLRTTDGGKNWSAMNFMRPTTQGSTTFLRAVWGFDANTVLVSGHVQSLSVSDSGFIMRTNDGGLTWTDVYLYYTSQINQLYFVSDDVGFASTVGSLYDKYHFILKTSDKGSTWTVIKSFGWSRYLISCWFPGSLRYGYAIGRLSEPEFWYDAYTVENGVESKIFTTYIPNEPFADRHLRSLTWCGDQSWLLDVFQQGNSPLPDYVVTLTEDNGATWTTLTNVNQSPMSSYKSASFSEQSLFVVPVKRTRTLQQLIKSTDKGRTWINQRQPDSVKNMNYVFALSKLIAFCVGDSGTILKTTDGGGVATSVEEGNAGEEFRIAPLPAHTSFSIALGAPWTRLSIRNMLGQTVYALTNHHVTQSTVNIDCSTWSPGLYSLCVETDGSEIYRTSVVVAR